MVIYFCNMTAVETLCRDCLLWLSGPWLSSSNMKAYIYHRGQPISYTGLSIYVIQIDQKKWNLSDRLLTNRLPMRSVFFQTMFINFILVWVWYRGIFTYDFDCPL